MRDIVFTIVSRNYAAQAATLMASVGIMEPNVDRIVVITDGTIRNPALQYVEQLDASAVVENFDAMALYYDALELNTSVKPFCFRSLLARAGVGRVVYLDPDIRLYAPLTPVWRALETDEAALIPHLHRPLHGYGEPTDLTILRSGVFNLGFLGLRAGAEIDAFLDWWAERCRFDARVAFEEGLFTDQRWVDLAPGFISKLAILRGAGLNLAYWNLEGRTLCEVEGEWRVDGEPLIFFHFSGFDPSRPDRLSKHQTRLLPAPSSPLAKLLSDYALEMKANGYAVHRRAPYGHDRLPSGRTITPHMRKALFGGARQGLSFANAVAAERWTAAPSPTAFLSDMSPARPGSRQIAEDDWFAGIEPHRGPSTNVWAWLQESGQTGPWRACRAVLQTRADLRLLFPLGAHDPAMPAWCIGREALLGRFDPDLIPKDIADATFSTIAALAVRYARVQQTDVLDEPEVQDRLRACLGLAQAARWPHRLYRGLLDALLCDDDRHLIRLGTSTAMAAIWRWRPDLQAIFDLRRAVARAKFVHWMQAIGQREYGSRGPLGGDAWRSFWIGQPQNSARGTAPYILVRDFNEALPLAVPPGIASAVCFDPVNLRFSDASGRETKAPKDADRVIYLTDPRCVPADAIALRANGVQWTRATGLWSSETLRSLSSRSVARGFVDEVVTLNDPPSVY